MILVIENEILSDFTDAQRQELLSLKENDRIYLITKLGDTVPVDVLPFITRIKAKLEIKKLSGNDSAFEKGFLYGSLAGSSSKDKVIILSAEGAPSGLAENCSWNEGFGMKPKKKVTRAAKPAEKKAPAGPADNSPASPDQKLLSSPLLADCLELLSGKEKAFRECLSEASDPEIGYRMLLGLKLGENGEKVWELTHKKFEKLRKLL